MPICRHTPEKLFREPTDAARRFLMGGLTRWVICTKCGSTGYWGGYGTRRRVRWGYGGPAMIQKAEEWNAWVAELDGPT